jgi:hypothetical protein
MVRIVWIRVGVRHLCESHKGEQQQANDRESRQKTGNGAALLELESGQLAFLRGLRAPRPEYKSWMLPALNG